MAPIRLGLALLVLLLSLPHLAGETQGSTAPPRVPFVVYGTLFLADANTLTVRVIGRFHPTAPGAAQAADGLFWGRADFSSVEAIDPRTGREVRRVATRYRPYDVWAANEKLYVTHTTRTADGFPLTVIDSAAGRILPVRIWLDGPVTGLAGDGTSLYVGTVGASAPTLTSLYRIDTVTDHMTRVDAREAGAARWLPSVWKGRLFVAWRAGDSGPVPPRIDVRDFETGAPVASLGPEGLAGVRQITGDVRVFEDVAYAPCQRTQGGPGIVVFDPEALSLTRVIGTEGVPDQLLFVSGGLIGYVDNPATAGTGGISLRIASVWDGRDVKRIHLLRVLRSHE